VGPTPPPNPYPYRKLYRNKDERFLAGVAAGLAEHLRLPTVVVRVVFIGLMLANGLGVLLYIAFWAVLPVKPNTGDRKSWRRRGNRLQRLGWGHWSRA
jgi:phage shock protein PspC (stress-responsive transcriptional regulator)